jgi:hypothetical protein
VLIFFYFSKKKFQGATSLAMEEILRDINYAYQRRHENESLAWNLMRGAFERHTMLLESLAMATTQQGQDETQVTETELLKQSRQFYTHDTVCVALLFLNAQYEHNVNESITGVLIEDTLQLLQLLDPESIKFGGPEGNHFISYLRDLVSSRQYLS